MKIGTVVCDNLDDVSHRREHEPRSSSGTPDSGVLCGWVDQMVQPTEPVYCPHAVHSRRRRTRACVPGQVREPMDEDHVNELLEHVSAEGIVLSIGSLKEYQWNERIRDFEMLVNWRGLQTIEDSWERGLHSRILNRTDIVCHTLL